MPITKQNPSDEPRRPKIDIQFTVKSAENMAKAIYNPELVGRYPIYEKAFTHFRKNHDFEDW